MTYVIFDVLSIVSVTGFFTRTSPHYQEVKALFEHELCPAWTSFEFAHNDSWYITFDDEDKAKRAYRHLREVSMYIVTAVGGCT